MGVVTSAINADVSTTFQALGYLKSRYANHSVSSSLELGILDLNTQKVIAAVSVLPSTFPQYMASSSPAPPVPKLASKGREILVGMETIVKPPTKPSSAEEERRAAKLKAMAEKVAALQAKKRPAG